MKRASFPEVAGEPVRGTWAWVRRVIRLMVVAALLSVFGAVAEAQPLDVPPGTSQFTFTDIRGRAETPITVFSHRPASCDASCPILFVMHGNTRNAAAYLSHWVAWAEASGVLVLAPQFGGRDWPGSRSYNQGDVGASAEPARWSFSVIEHLFDAVRTTQKDYRIFGHSAGAQFVHRLLFLLPDNRASVALMANAGWYTLPQWLESQTPFAWPHSMRASRTGERGVRAALAKQVVLLLGEADIQESAPDLDQSAASRAQGPHRLARGEHFFSMAQRAAAELGLPLNWRLVRVPGVGHDAKGMSRAAAGEL